MNTLKTIFTPLGVALLIAGFLVIWTGFALGWLLFPIALVVFTNFAKLGAVFLGWVLWLLWIGCVLGWLNKGKQNA